MLEESTNQIFAMNATLIPSHTTFACYFDNAMMTLEISEFLCYRLSTNRSDQRACPSHEKGDQIFCHKGILDLEIKQAQSLASDAVVGLTVKY